MLQVLGQSWWTAVALALASGLSDAPADPYPVCVDYRAEARHSGVGYDHWVHISNQCDHAVRCVVSTNVNPDQLALRVASKATETVLTWRGSPASEFTVTMSCRSSE